MFSILPMEEEEVDVLKRLKIFSRPSYSCFFIYTTLGAIVEGMDGTMHDVWNSLV